MEHQKKSAQPDIRTVVLVGRQDFGRCPLAARRPTALWPIGSRPALSRLLDHLADEGIESVVVCCGDDVSASVGAACENAPLSVTLLTEDLTKGTAGCLRDAVASDPGDLLIVLSGSIVSPPSIGPLIEGHRTSGAELTAVFNPSRPGETPCGPSAEIYLCRPDTLRHIPGGGYSDIKEGLIPSVLRAGGVVHPIILSKEVGNYHDREGYLQAVSAYLQNGSAADEDAVLGSDGHIVSVIPSASVHPTARIYGPVVIGDQARLSEGVIVIGPAVVGQRTVVGQDSVIVRSVLWERAEVGAQCEIRASVVGQGATVPDKAMLAEQTVPEGGRAAKPRHWTKVVAWADTRFGGAALSRVAYIAGSIVLLWAFLWSYWPTLTDLWDIWQGSDEYSAGLLVPFLAAYVLWSRRHDLARVAIRPALVAGTAVFILAQAMRSFGLYFMYGSARMFSMIVSVTAIVLLLLGWRFLWKSATILIFLCLMLPWPKRIQGAIALPLQRWATNSAAFCLELAGRAVVQDGNVITIGDTSVDVAYACNGLRMITAFFVISGLVVLLVKRAWWEKLIVLISSVPIALFCNTLRLTITAIVYTRLEAEAVRELFHKWGGYAMMPLALAMIVGELWLLARLTIPPVETAPEIVAREKPRHETGS